jgi:hypothetical protein
VVGVNCGQMITEHPDIHQTCDSRAGTAARECVPRYPGRRYPDAMCATIGAPLRETGSVSTGHPRSVRTPANEDFVIAAVELEPWRSSHDINREFGLSQRRVLGILADEQRQPYHNSRNANLFPDYRPRRMQLRLSSGYVTFFGQAKYL